MFLKKKKKRKKKCSCEISIYIEQFWLTLTVSRIGFIRIMIVVYTIALLQILRYLHDECLKVPRNTTFKKRFSKLDCKSCDS